MKRILQSTRPLTPLLRRFYTTKEIVISGTIPKGARGDEIRVGEYAQTSRIFTRSDVENYAALVGDSNPLHTSWNKDDLPVQVQCSPLLEWDGTNTKIVVHGMLVASLFTCIFGQHLPGAVYLDQTVTFCKPVYVTEQVTGKITVRKVRRMQSAGVILSCDTQVYKHIPPRTNNDTNMETDTENNKDTVIVAIKGSAKVLIPSLS